VSTLQAYRDDGPLAGWIASKVAPTGRPGADGHPLAWLVPPLVRAVEYGTLIVLTATVEPDALPTCFAFLGVLAFHHYDVVYRLRHQRVAPPAWTRAVGGGWDLRLAVAGLLALTGALGPGLVVAAIGLAPVYLTESAFSWIRFGKERRPAEYEDEDEDLE
jgi:Family of unknown function (DUF5941)